VFGVADSPLGIETATAGKNGSPHEPGGPDVAIHPALVANPIGQPCLLKPYRRILI
jgi:hypothetical protein